MDRPTPDTSVLLVVDVQERLAAAIPKDALERLTRNVGILLETARVTGLRVLASEQYPKGLGKTIEPIAQTLAELGVVPVAKMDFDACADIQIARALADVAPR
jgi:hypothetical protein